MRPVLADSYARSDWTVQQYKHLKELAEAETNRADDASLQNVRPPYGTAAEADPITHLMFFFESGPETTAACEWLVEQLGETMETRTIGCSLDYQLVSAKIPASLLEGMVDQPGYLYSAHEPVWETID